MALTLGQALHAYVGEPEAHHYLSDSAPSVEDRVDNVDHTVRCNDTTVDYIHDHTEAIFDEVETDFDGAVKVRIGESWGYINEDGMFTVDGDEACYWCGM